MNKKQYQSPLMKVMKVQQTQVLCGSDVTSSTSNEQYEEGSTDGWY